MTGAEQLQFDITIDLLRLLESESHLEAIEGLHDGLDELLYRDILRKLKAKEKAEQKLVSRQEPKKC